MLRTIYLRILLLKVLTISQVTLINCSHQEVDIICSLRNTNFDFIGDISTCHSTSSLSVTNYNTHVRNVSSLDQENIATESIEALYINNPTDLRFLPSGIKSAFPKLKAIRIFSCDLSHLDQEDMRQFGNEIQWILLWKTKLTALDSDLFKNNPNLVFISLEDNPIKYISQQIFESFKQMSNLKFISFLECECIKVVYQSEDNIQTFDWTNNTCNDVAAKESHFMMSNEILRAERITIDDIKNEFKQKADIVGDTFSGEIKNLEMKVEELTRKLSKYEDISTKLNSFSEKLDKAQLENNLIKEILF